MAESTPLHMYVGRWAVCAMGKIGKIETAALTSNGVQCRGKPLDSRKKGSDVWSAHNPRLLHKSYDALLDGIRANYEADKQF